MHIRPHVVLATRRLGGPEISTKNKLDGRDAERLRGWRVAKLASNLSRSGKPTESEEFISKALPW